MDGGVSLRPHPRYHQRGLPLLSELRIVSAGREAALDAAFESGALDIIQLKQRDSVIRAAQRRRCTDAVALDAARARRGLSLVGTKGGKRVRHQPAFRDERVRRALFLALDYRRISAREGVAAAYPTGPVSPSFASDALPPAELAAHPLFGHDPAEAQRLLAAAGVPGLAFSLEAPDRAPFAALVRVLDQQLRDGGFRPKLALVPDAAWRRDLVAGDFEAILFELEPVRDAGRGAAAAQLVGPRRRLLAVGLLQPALRRRAQRRPERPRPRRTRPPRSRGAAPAARRRARADPAARADRAGRRLVPHRRLCVGHPRVQRDLAAARWRIRSSSASRAPGRAPGSVAAL